MPCTEDTLMVATVLLQETDCELTAGEGAVQPHPYHLVEVFE